MKLKNQLTQEECKEYFYHKNGTLFWKNDLSRYTKKDSPVGYHKSKGYYQVRIRRNNRVFIYYLHVLLWNYYKGIIPDGHEIDHIKQLSNGGLNVIDNLRLVSSSINSQNKKTRSQSGYTNITKSKTNSINPWHVRIKKFKVTRCFDNLEDAIEYRNKMRMQFGLLPAIDK